MATIWNLTGTSSALICLFLVILLFTLSYYFGYLCFPVLVRQFTRRRRSLPLEIRGLSKRYPNGVQALDNLSLTIGNNMFGLLGPNGAGKSTLMRTIATLQDPDEGKILLNGLDVVANKDEVRRQLGYLPQEFGVYPRISASDMLHHLAVMKGIYKAGERK